VPLANKAFTASQAVTGARQDTKTELRDHHHHHHHHHHHAQNFFVIDFWVRATLTVTGFMPASAERPSCNRRPSYVYIRYTASQNILIFAISEVPWMVVR
jgi:hypothetical protein